MADTKRNAVLRLVAAAALLVSGAVLLAAAVDPPTSASEVARRPTSSPSASAPRPTSGPGDVPGDGSSGGDGAWQAPGGMKSALGRKTIPSPMTLFGVDIWTGDGSTYAQALQRQIGRYGRPEIVRTFYADLPDPWPGNAGMSGGPVVVSFKALPQDVIAGDYDAFFRDWFAGAPRDRNVYWAFYHEPEDNIESGQFTAPQYREAFRRLAGLADEAGNARLKATPIFMCWTLDPASGRTFADYYPGSDVVDVLGWDCYNLASAQGSYQSPSAIMGAAVTTSAEMRKPFGIAELGSLMAAGDDGTRRAGWIRSCVKYLIENGALWVSYFDAHEGAGNPPEYRLLDAPSRQAWRWAVSGR